MIEQTPRLEEVLATLYESEVNCGLESFWDGGFRVWIGDEMNGHLADGRICSDDSGTMALWFIENATRLFPQSSFAKNQRFGALVGQS
jgi:hypothetical protein